MEWSTDTVRPHERFAYWREAICRAVFNLTIEAPTGHFVARMMGRRFGPLRIALAESTGFQALRTRRDIERAPDDSYAIYLQLSSQAVISQCDRALKFQPGDVAISDMQHPLHAMLGGGIRVSAFIPREMIHRRAPWVRKAALRRLAANSPYVGLARRHILEMAENPAMSENATALLAENLCNLVSLASAADIPPSRMQPELQIEAMLAFCRRELHNGELNPQHVADRFGISVRTVHLRFRQIGQSFGRWILEERIRACAMALRDQNQRGLNISDIAFRWGFNDLSHFNKSFRGRFDCTPAEWRNGADT